MYRYTPKIINFFLLPIFRLVRNLIYTFILLYVLIRFSILTGIIDWSLSQTKEFMLNSGVAQSIQTEILINNRIYPFTKDLTNTEYVNMMKDRLNIKVHYVNENKIPLKGKLIAISNHPAYIESHLICEKINNVRQDLSAKFIAEVSGNQDKSAALCLIKDQKILPDGITKLKEYFDQGNALLVFPAGTVESDLFAYTQFRQDDRKNQHRFKSGFLRFAEEFECDIMPVYVHIEVSWIMKLLFAISPSFGRFIHEVFNYALMKDKTIYIIFGDTIPYEFNKRFKDTKLRSANGSSTYTQNILDFYREKVYGMHFDLSLEGIKDIK